MVTYWLLGKEGDEKAILAQALSPVDRKDVTSNWTSDIENISSSPPVAREPQMCSTSVRISSPADESSGETRLSDIPSERKNKDGGDEMVVDLSAAGSAEVVHDRENASASLPPVSMTMPGQRPSYDVLEQRLADEANNLPK